MSETILDHASGKKLLYFISACQFLLSAPTSVVEVINVLGTQNWDKLTRSAPWPADDPVPLWDTVTIFTQTGKWMLVSLLEVVVKSEA